MPHLIIEHDARIAFADGTLAALHAALQAADAFSPADLKSRFWPCATSRVGTGAPQASFVHATLALLSGRSEAVRADLAARLAHALAAQVRAPVGCSCALSVEVREMARVGYVKQVLDKSL